MFFTRQFCQKFWEFRGKFQVFRYFQQKHSFSAKSRSLKMSWEEEKQKLLAMKPEEKRKLFKKKYSELKFIPTWSEFLIEKGHQISPKIDALPENIIDGSKNAELAEKISVFSGDITTLEIDAIVNAANSSLKGGGGVDGAIHKAAGKSLLAECITLGGCPTGEAKITGAYNLPAKYVIHTVGPRGEKPDLLRNCYKNSLDCLVATKLRSIAFPCISTGIYGYPNLPAAHVACFTVRKFLEENLEQVDRVIFCLFLEQDQVIYEGVLQSYFPVNLKN